MSRETRDFCGTCLFPCRAMHHCRFTCNVWQLWTDVGQWLMTSSVSYTEQHSWNVAVYLLHGSSMLSSPFLFLLCCLLGILGNMDELIEKWTRKETVSKKWKKIEACNTHFAYSSSLFDQCELFELSFFIN